MQFIVKEECKILFRPHLSLLQQLIAVNWIEQILLMTVLFKLAFEGCMKLPRYKIQDILLSFCAYNYTYIRLFMQQVYKNILYISIRYKHSNYKLHKLNCFAIAVFQITSSVNLIKTWIESTKSFAVAPYFSLSLKNIPVRLFVCGRHWIW